MSAPFFVRESLDPRATVDDDVAWAEPEYSRGAVDRAGSTLRRFPTSRDERIQAMRVLSNWRASHAYPLNTFQVLLRRKTEGLGDALVVQRLKRAPSIVRKLRRMRTKLSGLQDIGGCRAVLQSSELVYQLRNRFLTSQMKHELVGSGTNYIAEPKPSGYRGIHLIYRHRSNTKPQYDGFRVEIQIRTRLQHAWATAVETAEMFTGDALKASEGHDMWLRFFALASAAFACKEDRPGVPGVPEDAVAVGSELRSLDRELGIIERFTDYTAVVDFINTNEDGSHFYLLTNLEGTNRLEIAGFPRRDLRAAEETYLNYEMEDGWDVVLVSADSVKALQRAYPNYFRDTSVFVGAITEFMRRS